jgi:hypothetical protein
VTARATDDRAGGRVLGPRDLNRATLARQSLLERSALDPVSTIERLGGLQAQEPASPYIALWTRLTDFKPDDLDLAIHEGRAVKATLMRGTLHLVGVDDYLHLQPAVRPTLQGLRFQDRFRDADVADIDAVAEEALAFADRPRSNAEIHEHLASLAASSGRRGEDVWWRVRRHAPFLHAPGDVPWSFGRRPAYVSARSWLPGQAFADDRDALEHLIRRYLGAFGPATSADLRTWSHVPAARLKPVIEAMPDVVTLGTEEGRSVLDLVDAPRPAADTPAPPRLLPMWDSVLLAHEDRTRVLPTAHRPRVIARNGDVLPTFLVDGSVAGLWWAEPDGARSRIVLEPFDTLSRATRLALDSEGEALAAMVGPLEPGVYARYRRSRARR